MVYLCFDVIRMIVMMLQIMMMTNFSNVNEMIVRMITVVIMMMITRVTKFDD